MPQSADQFSGIFICYRRDDSAGHAGRLYDRLATHFGDEQIFMDLDQIEPGEDFVHVLEGAVGSCEILLAVIGRNWLTSRDEAGRRLDNPTDFVRVEITSAFARGVRVIPVLVQGAQMPRAQDLPEALRPLSRRQAFDLSDQRWRQDVDSLVATLERILERQRASRTATAEERDRRAAEKVASAIPELTEPEQETAAARKTPAVETLPASAPASLFDDVRAVTSVTPPPRMGTSERVALVGFISCLVIFTAIWVLTKWKADEPQVNTNRNPTPTATPRTAQQETPSPTAETPRPPPGMVYVPGGKFVMGRDDGDEYERPAHEVTVGPFFVDVYEVTRGDYKKCVDEKQCPEPQGWTEGTYPERIEGQPVTGVDWDAANAYAQWRSKRDKVTYRLPTEEEWEFAAHGEDGRRYPWGNNWRAGLANADGASRAFAGVNSYPEGKSPFGVFNMVGNAWEWTASELTAYGGGQLPTTTPAGDWRVIRGGSFDTKRNQATTTYRRGYPARGAPDYSKIGLRCVSVARNSPTSP